MTEQSDKTPFEKFLAFTKKVVAVPKSEIDRREAIMRKRRKLKPRKGVRT